CQRYGYSSLRVDRLRVAIEALLEIRSRRGETFTRQRGDALIEIGPRVDRPSRLLRFWPRASGRLPPRDREHCALGSIGQGSGKRFGELFEDGEQLIDTDRSGQAPTAEQPAKNRSCERPGAPGMGAEIDR